LTSDLRSIERFTIGSVLSLSWRAWTACRRQVLLVIMPIAVADGIARHWVLSAMSKSVPYGWRYMISVWTSAGIATLALATLAFAVVRYAGGERPLPGDGVRIPWRRIPLILLTILLIRTIANWPGALLNNLDETSPILGSLIFTINSLIVSTVAFLCLPILLMERRSVAATLDRGVELMLRHPWRMLVLSILVWAKFWLFTSIVRTLPISNLAPRQLELDALRFVWVVIAISINSCVPAVAYYLLRSEQEGPTPGTLARVFE
jgi:hypothetical protein